MHFFVTNEFHRQVLLRGNAKDVKETKKGDGKKTYFYHNNNQRASAIHFVQMRGE